MWPEVISLFGQYQANRVRPTERRKFAEEAVTNAAKCNKNDRNRPYKPRNGLIQQPDGAYLRSMPQIEPEPINPEPNRDILHSPCSKKTPHSEFSSRHSLSRRKMLGGLVAGASAAIAGTFTPLASATAAVPAPDRSLSLRNVHTLEELDVTYWSKGEYIYSAVLKISHHMRDHRENETLLMDTALLDVLWKVRQKVDPAMRFDVISGYRTPKTNAMLRQKSTNVAKFSYHMVGKAVDIGTFNAPISEIRKAGLAAKGGGVGYYPKSRFVHLDTGPVRSW